VFLAWAAWMNGSDHRGIGVRFSKDRSLPPMSEIDSARWNSHSFILIGNPSIGDPAYWGPGASVPNQPVNRAWMVIDGEAATATTEWQGDRAALDWVRHDITSLPHHLRRGSAAVIGVGGGRDVLSALWAGNDRVVGIEIDGVLLDMLTRTHRSFAGIAESPAVELVHDEARSYLSRTAERFDVLQMSLIDTWAATGAGAFTLTENGLYTREAWHIFLNALKPGGIFSVSRWFSPTDVSETNRLMALGVAALIESGAEDPRSQLLLVSRGSVATLMVSTQPFSPEDRAVLSRVAAQEEFELLATPWTPGAIDRLERLSNARSMPELDAAAADPFFDFSPPTDQRPYFFNILKLSREMAERIPEEGIAWGNLGATMTLAALCVIAAVLVGTIIVMPLAITGLPQMRPLTFLATLAYFATIGCGYMLVQIPFLQRFSVLLGHPTYTFAIILFSMILFTGIGSFLSDRLRIERGYRLLWLPAAIAASLVGIVLLVDPAIRSSAALDLTGRTLVVLAFTAPISLLLGGCFPIGMRLVGRVSDSATAWMWGVNGACGVIASVVAVAVSMWVGIDTNLLLAAVLYAALAIPMVVLARG
jgi:spermidine synthase